MNFIKKRDLKFTMFLLFVTLFFSNMGFADKLNDFKAPNYIYLEQTAFSGNIGEDLKKLLKNRIAFVFVSGCYLDREALPGFFKIVKKYKDAKFIRISQFAAKKFMLDRYASFGAPKVYLMVNGNIASFQMHYFEKKGKRYASIGWERAIVKWADEVYPVLKDLIKYKNIVPLTSYNYADEMKSKKIILFRANSRSVNFKYNVKTLYRLAKKYPGYNFGITTGTIPYNQEFDYKFLSTTNGFSIITNGDSVNGILKMSYRRKISSAKVEKWIKKSSNSELRQFQINKNGNYLKKLILAYKTNTIAAMKPHEFKVYNKKYKVVKKLNPMHSFYVLLNAATSHKRNIATAKIIIRELTFKSRGGPGKVFRGKILREKVYATVIKRKINNEHNSKIKNELIKLKNLYEK